MNKRKIDLNKKSVSNFLIKLMVEMKKNPRNIGIITDKDGTILLNKELSETLVKLKKIRNSTIWVIANSGRTVGDMKEAIEKEKIPKDCFDYIIGDNGGEAINLKNNEELFKHVMEGIHVKQIINEFLKIGGTNENIRFANGSSIIAQNNRKIRKYYKDRKNVKFIKKVDEVKTDDITKITLTGTKEEIEGMEEYIKTKLPKYSTHKGKTSFPTGKNGNSRMDCTSKNDKGQAMQYMIDLLELDKCIVLGNDLNDLGMFKLALKRGDSVVIANSEYPGVTRELVNKLIEFCRQEKIDWKASNILILQESNVNKFLQKAQTIMSMVNRNNTKRKFFTEQIKCNPDLLNKKIISALDTNSKNKKKKDKSNFSCR